MNLELPFSELTDVDLDTFLARIDQQLDALFLDEVHETIEAIRAEPVGDAAAPAASTAA